MPTWSAPMSSWAASARAARYFARVRTGLIASVAWSCTCPGAERRFERHGEPGGVLVIDDYGHHPTEIAAVLAAARATLGRRLVVAFQPHRYSRTQKLLEAFGPSMKDADEIVLTDIYAASEDPIPGITVDTLADAVRLGSGRPVHVVPRLDDVVPALLKVLQAGDVVITLGAGSIGTLAAKLLDALARRGSGPGSREARLESGK